MMYAENAYPSHLDIKYGIYVPGTATWIYYFVKKYSYSIQNCFFANIMIYGCCICSLFSFIPKEWENKTKNTGYALISVYIVTTLIMNSGSLYTLKVDTALSTVTISIMGYLLYCNHQYGYIRDSP